MNAAGSEAKGLNFALQYNSISTCDIVRTTGRSEGASGMEQGYHRPANLAKRIAHHDYSRTKNDLIPD
jgi:hypothetical protein